MTTTPIIGAAEDFTVQVITELGAQVSQNALSHVAINDEHLASEALELPQLLFYYQAVWCRLTLRAAQAKIRLKEAEANAFVKFRSQSAATGDRMPVDEINARILLEESVKSTARDVAELESRADAVQGILHSLRQKGYSLQLVSGIRQREEDWLRTSFTNRFKNNPKREQIASSLNMILGDNIVS